MPLDTKNNGAAVYQLGPVKKVQDYLEGGGGGGGYCMRNIDDGLYLISLAWHNQSKSSEYKKLQHC